MRLYLVQHAEAEPEEVNPDRPITSRGRADIERCALFASRGSMVSATALYHSGKTRARETAGVLAGHLKPERGTIESEGLLPNDDPAIWAGRLSQLHEDMMLVGHLPHLGRLASCLLCGDPARVVVEFTNACLLCMYRKDNGEWSVQWMIIPGLLPRE
jgi:phosphohistidine phosphatase